MAVLTAQGISRVAVALLVRQLVLPNTVTAVAGEEFAGSNGDTITVRVRQPRSARTQSAPGAALTADPLAEVPVDVTLAHLYDLANITDQDLSLNIEDFAMQVTEPQTEAVATKAEAELAAVMNALSSDLTVNVDGSDMEEVILEARETLGRADVPPADRFFAVSPELATFVLGIDKFVRVNESGSDQALRDAVIGRLYGFTFVESPSLDAGEGCAYHRSGFAFANRTPVRPRGATDSATATTQGIGLRHVFQYSAATATDQSLVSTFAGAAAVYDDNSGTDNRRFVKIATEPS
jgi:hypothetical protein